MEIQVVKNIGEKNVVGIREKKRMLLQAAKLVGAGRATVGLGKKERVGVKRLRRKRVNGGKEGGVGKVVGIQYDPNRTGGGSGVVLRKEEEDEKEE